MSSHKLRSLRLRPVMLAALATTMLGAGLAVTTASATLPPWLQHLVAGSPAEGAFYRVMHLPAVEALYPRPAKEAEAEVAKLPSDNPALYALRARADEAALDEAAAESDWKLYAAHAKDTSSARIELADFYARRLMIPREIAALRDVASTPAGPEETYLEANRQRSWRTFNRLLAVAAKQGLPPAETRAIYAAFLDRYPQQPAVYARALTFLIEQKDFAAADSLVARYRQQVPDDTVFPVRAQALIAGSRQGPEAALAVYDAAFQPLWPSGLIQSYLALLDGSHRQRAFVGQARAQLAAHPDGPQALNALARIFYYDQLAGRSAQAQATLDSFRIAREARAGSWTPEDLATLAAFEAVAQNNAEAARYNFALASTPGTLSSTPGVPGAGGGEPAGQAGLAALVEILLRAPDQALALGAGNLSLYSDIATLDQGPGYWNGILSLWLNGTDPQREYQTEDGKAQSYFHRSKAAELLAELDRKYPQAPERAGLHAQLIGAETQYGEPDAVIAAGKQYLADFPSSPARFDVANLLADAYARQKDTAAEFALYDSLLTELAVKTQGMPLTAASPAAASVTSYGAQSGSSAAGSAAPDPEVPATPDPEEPPASGTSAKTGPSDLLTAFPPTRASLPEANQYQQILDRYLGRLVAAQQLPQALALLRRQLDRNPNDPLLYERLATFLQQNNLSAPQEEVFKLAYARFQRPTYYDRLARLYLREKKREAYAALTRQVVDIFSGTELDRYFATVVPSASAEAGPQLALQLNLYAAKRFPHDLVFTRNLLSAYQAKPTANAAAYEALLRRQWWAADDLRDQFFAFLTRTGKLKAELAQLQIQLQTQLQIQPQASAGQPLGNQGEATAAANPAAMHELAEAELWVSHPEPSAPLFAQLATLYPADPDRGDRAVSIFRSLSYLDTTPASLDRAVAIEQSLLEAAPDSPDRLATLGDLYAEATAAAGEDLPQAGPCWRRIPALHPGTPAGSLTAATIFWDYFQYDDALGEIRSARERFHSPTLFGYQAGAIQENRHDLQAAVAEYTAVVARPPAERFFSNSLDAAVLALLKPPSDAADSNLQSTAEDLFNSAEARDRLLELAVRPSTAALVDKASAEAVAAAPTPIALTLRADVLVAEHRTGELPVLLNAALTRASNVDEAAAIGDLARSHSGTPANGDALLREVDVTLDPADPKVTRRYAPGASYALTAVYEAALAREAALTPDPVQAIQLQYEEASSLEARKHIAAAQSIIERVYKVNPRLLGVVRATTDFYARTKQPPRAIATLLDAAKVAIPKLARDFTLEAANRATESGNFAQGRAFAQGLLVQTPYDPAVLAAVAASYAQANDAAGLKTFYLAQIDKAAADPALDREARRQDTALLRRGLIPALTRLHDDAGAEAQYIALLSAFPEDSATAQQAALYSIAHNQQAQLLDFLNTTVKASPNDSRFAVLLAQVQTTFEDLPAALTAYNAAIALRKDRVDLYQARADLELRLAVAGPNGSDAAKGNSAQGNPAQGNLAQLDRAADDFDRLYTLSYHDPQYEVRLAEIRARQGRPADAVKALALAYPPSGVSAASNAFTQATLLEQWNLLAEARTAAETGVRLAGPKLLTESQATGPPILARILTRLGKPDVALSTLLSAARSAQASAPSTAVLQAQASAAGMGGSSADADQSDAAGDSGDAAGASSDAASDTGDAAALRKQLLEQRRQTIDGNLRAAVATMGTTVQTYFTPEQKASYAATLDGLHAGDPHRAILAASAAGFAEREAAWRRQILLAKISPAPSRAAASSRSDGWDPAANLQAFIALEQHRLAFAELAQTLEAYAAQQRPDARAGLRKQAADAFRGAGDIPNELRVLRTLHLADDPALRDRFFDLLLAHDRAALASVAGAKDANLADAAVNYAVEHASRAETLAAVGARARSLPAVWRPASAALTGLYFASQAPGQSTGSAANPATDLATDLAGTAADFQAALASERSIAERLGKPADPAAVLTGNLWFFYGSHYGIFLNLPAAAGKGSAEAAEDFLPARLEQTPGSSAAYLDLARSYAEAGNLAAAQAEYAHVLELSPTGADALLAHDEQAELLFRLNHREQAVAEWRAALALLLQLEQRNNFPERFYTGFISVAAHLAEHHVDLTPELAAIVRPYLARNGNYRSNELLEAVYKASPTAAAGAALIVSLADSAINPDLVLSDLVSAESPYGNPLASERVLAPWLSPASRETILLHRLDLARKAPETVPGDASSGSSAQVISIEASLLSLAVANGNYTQAEALLAAMPQSGSEAKSGSEPKTGPAQSANEEDPMIRQNRLLVAAHAGRLPALLDSYRSLAGYTFASGDASTAASEDFSAFSAAAAALSTPRATPADLRNTLLLREFIFEQKQQAHTLLPTDFLSLAQARLAIGDLPGAVTILRRLALQPTGTDPGTDSTPTLDADVNSPSSPQWVGSTQLPANPYSNTDAAARLLESTKHPAEAIAFLQSLTQAVPWNAGYRLRLAEAQMAAGQSPGIALEAIARNASAPYATRASAARDLARLKAAPGSSLGSAELTALARPNLSVADVSQPFFTASRLVLAAEPATSSADRVTLLREAIMLTPNGPVGDRARLDLLLAEADPAGSSLPSFNLPSDARALIRLIAQAPQPAAAGTSAADSETDADGAAGADGATEADSSGQESGTPETDESDPGESDTSGKQRATVSLPAIARNLDLATQVRLASLLAASSLNDGSPQTAVAYLELGLRLDAQSTQPDRSLAGRLAQLNRQIVLDARNRTRRPVFHAELAQPNAVRPRLALADIPLSAEAP